MKIVIPMTGYGSRFVAAGYKELKPLIRIGGGMTILEWIIKGMYSESDEFIIVCREEHIRKIEGMKEFLYSLGENVRIATIDNWIKKGPVYDVLRASDYIDDDEPCIINYCDIYVDWNWQETKQELSERECDGAVFCFHGFHPALVPEKNVFASCRVDSDGYLTEIREKYSFTVDKTEGNHSAGIYYFKKGRICKEYFKQLIDSEQMIQGEYYVSLVYNFMIRAGLKVWVPNNIKVFCNWGTPEDLEDYLFWISTAKRIDKPVNILIPMAGAGQRFVNAGYAGHKPTLPIIDYKSGMEIPMVVAATQDVPCVCNGGSNITFVDRDFHREQGVEDAIKQFYPEANFITLDHLTDGQAATCLKAKQTINNEEELIISACDNGMVIDQLRFDKLRMEADVIVFTQKSDNVLSNPNAYGWCVIDGEDNVIRVSVKKAISETPNKDHAVVATFWFRQGKLFVRAAEKMIYENDRVNNEFYVDQVINHCIELGMRTKVFCIERYIGWGTPEDYENYCGSMQYWREFLSSDKYIDKG